MTETAIRFEDVPRILTQILFELKRINNGAGIDAPPFEDVPPKVETAEQQTAEPQEVNHDQLKKICLTLNRKDSANKDKIKAIIAEFTDGKLADVPVGQLGVLKTKIEALNV